MLPDFSKRARQLIATSYKRSLLARTVEPGPEDAVMHKWNRRRSQRCAVACKWCVRHRHGRPIWSDQRPGNPKSPITAVSWLSKFFIVRVHTTLCPCNCMYNCTKAYNTDMSMRKWKEDRAKNSTTCSQHNWYKVSDRWLLASFS